MDRFDGTAVRQLDLLDRSSATKGQTRVTTPRKSLRLLRKDIYAELARRRRRAQIAARHLLDAT